MVDVSKGQDDVTKPRDGDVISSIDVSRGGVDVSRTHVNVTPGSGGVMAESG